MSSRPTFTIRTLGCKANQYDSQVIREELLNRGLVECDGDGETDVCIVNTCTVTSQSDAKSRQAIRTLRRGNPNCHLLVTGCYAHMRPIEVGRIPGVDAVMDNPSKEILADRVRELLGDGEKSGVSRCSGITFFAGHTRAFVKIQDGCDKKCSYCVVRFARGNSRSRAIPEILNEIRRLVANGYSEVVLTGIHIGSFGTDDGTKENRLPELMERMRGVEGLLRVRLSSIDPNEISPGLIEAIRNSTRICRHLHLPLQSGSDRILGKMNRDYTREEYLNIISLLKKELPDFSVTTDVMVGFPGETDEDFAESLGVVSQAEFSKVHIFPFSRRPGTPADRLPDHVVPRVVKERISRLSSEAEAVALKRRQKLNGAVVEVLVERECQLTGRKGLPDFFNGADVAHEGFSSNYLRTVFLNKGEKTEGLKNRLVRVRVEAFDERCLFGHQV